MLGAVAVGCHTVEHDTRVPLVEEWKAPPSDPRFDNQVGTLELDGRRVLARLERAVPSERGYDHPLLEVADEYSLT